MSDCMSDEKWERLPSKEVEEDNVWKHKEKEHLDKLVDDHWGYIEGVLVAASPTGSDFRIAEIEYHYKTAAKHFWGHAREYHTGDTL